MRPRDKAWLGLAAYVALWDMTCGRGQTLSEAVSDYRRRWPLSTIATVVYVVAHLLDLLPERIDLLHAANTLRHR